jgi:hypothetical protein
MLPLTSPRQKRPSCRKCAERPDASLKPRSPEITVISWLVTDSDYHTTQRAPRKRRGRSDYYAWTDTRLAGRLKLAMAAWTTLRVPRWRRPAWSSRGTHTTLITYSLPVRRALDRRRIFDQNRRRCALSCVR